MNILGIHGGVTIGQHDPGAALICDGKLIAACEEERFTRIKSPRGFLPIYSIKACLKEAKLSMSDIDVVVHPGETYEDMPERIRLYLTHYFGCAPKVELINHQLAHLASAYYCSGFDKAAVLSYDAVGDRLSTALAVADRNKGITVLETRDGTNSLGFFYGIMTSYLGFQPNEGEYKVMGLAPYGKPGIDLSSFLKPAPDGFSLNPEFMKRKPPFMSIFEPLYNEHLIKLLGPARMPDAPLTDHYKNVAYATQATLEECAISLVRHLHDLTGLDSLCLAGGVALNCSLNRVLKTLPYVKNLFVQPAASDRGLALGCAVEAAFRYGKPVFGLSHVFTGPSYSNEQVVAALKLVGADYESVANPAGMAAKLISQGRIVGWWQGKSEYGPRALGNRSILADPRPFSMKQTINDKIKFREEFRPFAPAVLEDKASELFEMDGPSPFMTVAFNVREEWRPKIAAVTHVNNTARVQTVDQETNSPFYSLISEFESLTGVPAVLNTSFNIKGQPIVETALDALETFVSTGMDALFIGPYFLKKKHCTL